jgi:hypothetical protein
VLQPDDDDVDLVVLVPRTAILPPDVSPSPVLNAGRVKVDGDCKIFGYPWGRGIRLTAPDGGGKRLPFTRACGVDAMDASKGLWILHGIYDKGESGAPLFIDKGTSLVFLGVVSAYAPPPLDILNPPDTRWLMRGNSGGLILAFDTKIAADLIKEHPIGPLRHAKP